MTEQRCYSVTWHDLNSFCCCCFTGTYTNEVAWVMRTFGALCKVKRYRYISQRTGCTTPPPPLPCSILCEGFTIYACDLSFFRDGERRRPSAARLLRNRTSREPTSFLADGQSVVKNPWQQDPDPERCLGKQAEVICSVTPEIFI